MNKNVFIIIGILFLCGLTLLGVFFLPAWAGILIVWSLGVAILLWFFFRKNKVEAYHPSVEVFRKPANVNELAVYLQRIREEEKMTLSREMHDELGQLLTALRMDIAWLDRGISEEQLQLRH